MPQSIYCNIEVSSPPLFQILQATVTARCCMWLEVVSQQFSSSLVDDSWNWILHSYSFLVSKECCRIIWIHLSYLIVIVSIWRKGSHLVFQWKKYHGVVCYYLLFFRDMAKKTGHFLQARNPFQTHSKNQIELDTSWFLWFWLSRSQLQEEWQLSCDTHCSAWQDWCLEIFQ